MPQDSVQLTRIKLKIIEGRALTEQDADYLKEGLAVTALATWLGSQAWSYFKKELRKRGPGLVKKYPLLQTIDQRLAQTLGRAHEAQGAVLTAYVMSLIDSGSPVEAAINLGKMAATDLAAMQVANTVKRQGETTLAQQQHDKIIDKMQALEPQAVALNQTIQQSYQDHVMAGDEDDPDTATPRARPQPLHPNAALA